VFEDLGRRVGLVKNTQGLAAPSIFSIGILGLSKKQTESHELSIVSPELKVHLNGDIRIKLFGGRTEMLQNTLRTFGLSGLADFPAIVDKHEIEIEPVLSWDYNH